MDDGGYTILHRKDERGVIVESKAFGPDDEVPEDFGKATYTKIDPVTARKREVAESKLTPWESPVAKGMWVGNETEAVEQAVEDEVDEDSEPEDDEELTGAEEEVDESIAEAADDETGAEQEQDETVETSSDVPVPPQGGPGSGKDVWAQYAAANGVSVPGGASRDEIIAACEKAGVPVD